MFGECHAHIFMNGYDYRSAVQAHRDHPDVRLIRKALQAYRDAGVTFVRDGGDHFGVSALAKMLAPEYGIRYITPIFAIFKKGHYGRVVGEPFEDMHDFAHLVERAKSQGADFIKIMTSGIMTFRTPDGLTEEGLSREEVREMVHIAHASGMKVMSHTNGSRGVIDAALAGVDSLEHGNFQTEESLQALAEGGAVWVPTCSTVRNLIGDGRFPDAVLKEIWQGMRRNIRRGRDLGIPIALGSDAGAYRVLHGQGIKDEYAAFREIFPDDPSMDAWLERSEEMIQKWQKIGK
ncbi:MAG: amidohydrolase family protein [Bilifractor sp.]